MIRISASLCLFAFGLSQVNKWRDFKKNLFLTQDQLNDLQLRNITNNGTLVYGHVANQNNRLTSESKIVIVGGSVVGFAQALKLLENGFNVTLINSQEESNNIFSPFYFRPTVSKENILNILSQYQFTITYAKFLVNSIPSYLNDQLMHSTRCNFNLAQITSSQMEYLKRKGLFRPSQFTAKGLIAEFETTEDRNIYTSRLEIFNIPFQNKDDKELLMPTESNLHSEKLIQDLRKYCERNFKNTFQVIETEADSFVLNQNQVVKGIKTKDGILLGDSFIVTTECNKLCRFLKLDLPIIKYEKPINEYQGDLEFVVASGEHTMSSCEGVITQTGKQSDNQQARSSSTSITPDDIPVIGPLKKFDNVYLNGGHGERAVSNAFGAAEVLYQVLKSTQFKDYDYTRFYFI